MRTIINEYLKFRKAGFFKSSIAIFIIILLPSIITLIFNSLSGDELPSILYGVFTVGDSFIAVLVPLIIVANYNNNKYKLYTSLPIKNDNLFKFIYLEVYAIIIIAFIVTGLINFISYDTYYLFIQMFKMVLALCLSNAFIPGFVTEEFVTNSERQQTNLVVILIVIILVVLIFMAILIIVGPKALSNFLNNSIANIVFILLYIIGMLIAILTLKKSYLHTMDKVRLIKYTIGNNNNKY